VPYSGTLEDTFGAMAAMSRLHSLSTSWPGSCRPVGEPLGVGLAWVVDTMAEPGSGVDPRCMTWMQAPPHTEAAPNVEKNLIHER
jgi:hypothetical protein